MNYIHIIDDKMRDSLIEMINYGQSSDVSMAINILEHIDLNDKQTSDNMIHILHSCSGLRIDVDYDNDSSTVNDIHFSYTGKRGENEFVIVNSKSVTAYNT